MGEKRERILFLGNGVNRVAGRNEPFSWGKLLDDLESAFVLPAARVDGLPYSLRIERIQNYALLEGKDFLAEWREKLASLKPTFAHRLMAQVVHDSFSRVLTTNYDDAMERALKELPCKNKTQADSLVTHIHGSVKELGSKLVMTQQTYIDTAFNLSEKSWLAPFCEEEIHICGFSMDEAELVIWKALRERQKYLRERVPNFARTKNHVFVYLFYTEEDEEKQRALASLLHSYGTRPILIPVPHGDFRSAWLLLYGRLSMILDNQRFSEENSQYVCTERYSMQESKNLPLVTAYASSAKHPNCAWVSISRDKREHYTTLYFYVDLDGSVSMWQCSTEAIEKGYAQFKMKPCGSGDYHFYLDVHRGCLMFAAKGMPATRLEIAVNLHPIADVAQFDSLLKSYMDARK